MGYWGVVNNCLKNADVILLIMDARVPEETRNKEVEKKVRIMNKEIIFVFNKSDLISKDIIKNLGEKYEGSFFVSAKNRNSVNVLRKFLEKKSLGRDKALRVALIGYPNVGKSSILNLLVPDARAKVSSVSGTTRETQWIRVKNLRFMDSPGVIPRTDSKVRISITASKDPHKIKDVDKSALELIRLLRKKDEKILKKFYGIDFKNEESNYDIFLKIGKIKGFLIKGGEIDENRTAVRILDDWQKGRIGLK